MMRAMLTAQSSRGGGAVSLRTLILRGPSRSARRLLGVSMVIILSRPLSSEPNTFPPLLFFSLSPTTAMSSDRDLGSAKRVSGQVVPLGSYLVGRFYILVQF